MRSNDFLSRYIEQNNSNLTSNKTVLNKLKKCGVFEAFIFENFNIGYSNGSLIEMIKDNKELAAFFTEAGIVKSNREVYKGCLTIPVYDDKTVVNIAFYHLTKKTTVFLNDEGIFNQAFTGQAEEVIFVANPLYALLLIQHDVFNITFCIGNDEKYPGFLESRNIKKAAFIGDGKAKLFYLLESAGINVRRVELDFEAGLTEEVINTTLKADDSEAVKITEIENGFLFEFPHLNYRVIGNFKELTMTLRANIKAYLDERVFVDSINMYKNRERNNFMYGVANEFNIHDDSLIKSDLNRILTELEKYREQVAESGADAKPQLTEDERETGLDFLRSDNLIEAVADDITALGYVRERKNKILMYLIMTSRLLANPLHAIIVSRSGAGKSQLLDIIETLCPPDELESISDLSPQALYYMGQDDLVNKFIVIGEKEGSKAADYPLRELISKKSITKSVPVKNPSTGQLKTVKITVNGPVSFVETTTSSQVNSENLNRCFVIGIDESEEQTRLINNSQRLNYTLEGRLNRQNLDKIKEKHIAAQRLLRNNIHVFNSFAPLLTFPTSRLQARRDNEKLLKLINVICFLNQYRREIKTHTLDNGEVLEYIECTVDDYRVAFELLSDGVLDNTLDDLPRPARALLDIIKRYLQEKNQLDGQPQDQIIFTRKAIREFASWSFAQVRNNMKILKEYEYIQLVKRKTGTAHFYRLSPTCSDTDFMNTIITPEELEKRIKVQEKTPVKA